FARIELPISKPRVGKKNRISVAEPEFDSARVVPNSPQITKRFARCFRAFKVTILALQACVEAGGRRRIPQAVLIDRFIGHGPILDPDQAFSRWGFLGIRRVRRTLSATATVADALPHDLGESIHLSWLRQKVPSPTSDHLGGWQRTATPPCCR